MPKHALIHNIGGLTCLLCQLLHFCQLSGHFVIPAQLHLYRIVYHLNLILPTANNAKVAMLVVGNILILDDLYNTRRRAGSTKWPENLRK